MKVGNSDPSSLAKGLKKSRAKALADCGDFCSQPAQSGVGNSFLDPSSNKPNDRRLGAPKHHQGRRRLQGTLKNLVVMFRFSDHTGRTMPSVSDIDTLMNSQVNDPDITPTGSVRDVFLENSGGALVLDSTVAAWVTISRTEIECAGGESGGTFFHTCLKEALDLVDPMVNFNNFDDDNNNWIDAITFLHSGYGAEWSKFRIVFLLVGYLTFLGTKSHDSSTSFLHRRKRCVWNNTR